MKTKSIIVVLLALVCAINLKAQSNTGKQKTIIIEDRFFRQMPISPTDNTKIYILKTPSGTRALGLELTEPLPAKALELAVPIEQINEGEVLLKMFHDAIANQKGIVSSVTKTLILREGERFPDFVATDINGKNWSNADIEGKVMVLNLWFTGCGPCLAEMPELSQWKTEMPEVMFFSSTYEDAESARPVLESRKFNWIPIVNDTHFKNYVGNNGYPITIVINKEGIIAKVEYGTSPIQRAELKETIQSLR